MNEQKKGQIYRDLTVIEFHLMLKKQYDDSFKAISGDESPHGQAAFPYAMRTMETMFRYNIAAQIRDLYMWAGNLIDFKGWRKNGTNLRWENCWYIMQIILTRMENDNQNPVPQENDAYKKLNQAKSFYMGCRSNAVNWFLEKERREQGENIVSDISNFFVFIYQPWLEYRNAFCMVPYKCDLPRNAGNLIWPAQNDPDQFIRILIDDDEKNELERAGNDDDTVLPF